MNDLESTPNQTSIDAIRQTKFGHTDNCETGECRKKIIGEICAFSSEYAHSVLGRDVVIVEQLLLFLKGKE